MQERIEQELALLREIYPALAYDNRWVLIPQFTLPSGWSETRIHVAFHIRDGFPGVSPYGIYVPTGLRYNGTIPGNYADPAPTQPPFGGTWAVFSWEADLWRPTADPRNGHNLLNWVQGFDRRFKQGL